MNILLVAPNEVEVPPYQGYGGTERVIYDLALQFARHGHTVDVICKKTSKIHGDQVCALPYPNEQSEEGDLNFLHNYISSHGDKYDLVNLHIFKLEYVRRLSQLFNPLVISIHYYVDEARIRPFADLDAYYLVQSGSQERFFKPFLGDRVKGILQGIRTDHIPFRYKPFAETATQELRLDFLKNLKASGIQRYLLVLSKISRRKGQFTAIKLSKILNNPIIIAGKPNDDYEDARTSSVDYFYNIIKPQVDNRQIFYFGNANEREKYELMRNALAFVLPTGFEDEWWNEAFGRVVAESLATGTPVVAHKNGAMKEQITDGRNGYLFTTFDEALDKLKKIDKISRKFCRQDALKRLDADRFARECLKHFNHLVNNHHLSNSSKLKQTQTS